MGLLTQSPDETSLSFCSASPLKLIDPEEPISLALLCGFAVLESECLVPVGQRMTEAVLKGNTQIIRTVFLCVIPFMD